jgi:hypothetical protein
MSEFILCCNPMKSAFGLVKGTCDTSSYWDAFMFKIQIRLPQLNVALGVGLRTDRSSFVSTDICVLIIYF